LSYLYRSWTGVPGRVYTITVYRMANPAPESISSE
jgi:hypothetical protein